MKKPNAGNFPKTVFEYDNYRIYLKDYYSHSKTNDKKFSHRYFSRLAGFKSSSVLKQVIDGDINIAEHSIEKFTKALKLNKKESAFFCSLVHLNQATSLSEKQRYAEELMHFNMYRKTHPLSSAQFNYLKHWYFVTVRELVGLDGFKDDPEWIADHVRPAISPSEAKKAVEELLTLGLLARDPLGQLIQAHADLSTGDEVMSPFVAPWHRQMMTLASESIERDSREVRDISSVTISISTDSVATIKQMVQRFRKEIMLVASREQAPNSVYQVNFQIFPTSKKSTGEEPS